MYVQAWISDQEILNASLKEAWLNARRWELEAKEVVDRAARADVERDAGQHEAAMALLETDAASSARAQMESELAQVQRALTASEGVRLKAESELDSVQQALVVAGEACRKAEEENCHLTDERLPLIMELGASKDELSAFQAKVTMEKKAMEKEFDVSGDVIFNYGYGCCAFAHNICGSEPMIPAEMPDTIKPLPLEFFINPRCPPSSSSDFPTAATIGEEPPAKSPSAAIDRIEILPVPITRVDEESNVAAEV